MSCSLSKILGILGIKQTACTHQVYYYKHRRSDRKPASFTPSSNRNNHIIHGI
uniref:Uncharacterized protein n=1 Tax=Arundo donax TaxID=35708 RepID=A0A0A9FX07_ARUDO